MTLVITRNAAKSARRACAAGLVALLVAVLLPLASTPAQAALNRVGPVDAENGFPTWFGDENELRLEPCLDPNDALCLPQAPPFDPANGEMSFPDNFPEEAFYWSGEANVENPDDPNQNALLVLAQEMAFDSADGLPAQGHQTVFGRVRIRVEGLQQGTYTVTHPYGVDTFEVTDTTETRDINFTDDQGCLVAPCGDFSSAISNRIGPFLQWDSGAPAGYVGDPNVEHTVSGSPFNTNLFRVQGPGLPGACSCLETNLFAVSGKIAGPLSASTDAISFGGQNVGTTSAPRTVTLTNLGTSPLTVTGIAKNGANASDFAVSNDGCTNTTLALDATCTFDATFAPTAEGPLSASLSISHDQVVNSPIEIALDGRGTPAGAAPLANVTPPSIDFGEQRLSTSSPAQTVTVSNDATATASLQIFGVSLQGADVRDFSIVDNGCSSAVLDPGTSCDVNVRFAPVTGGTPPGSTYPKSATLSITDDSSTSPHAVALSGTAVRGLTDVGAVDPANGFPGSFTDSEGVELVPCLDPNDPMCLPQAAPFDPANGPMTFPTNFPEEAFYFTGDASVENPANPNQNAALVLAQEMAFDSADGLPADTHQIVFGRVRIRAEGLQQGTYTVTHPYGVDTFEITDAAEVRDINFTDDQGCLVAPCGDFASALNNRIGPFLHWDSGAPAGYVGDPAVEHTVTGSPFGTNFFRIEGPGLPGACSCLETNLFSLSGKTAGATPPAAPGIAIDPASIDFGAQQVGTTSAARTVTVSNPGTADLDISDIAIVGSTDYSVAAGGTTCSVTSPVAPGTSCTIAVQFAPTTAGLQEADLQITDNAVDSPHTVALTGSGSGVAAATLSTARLNFGTQTVGTVSNPQIVTVSSTGDAPLTVSGVTLQGADAGQYSVAAGDCTAASIASGSSCSIRVTFAPTSAGDKRAATLVIADNAPDSPQSVSLRGKARVARGGGGGGRGR